MSEPVIKQLLASSSTYTTGRAGCEIWWIVVHYTGCEGSAYNNAVYFQGGNRNASAHYFLDGGGTIYQSVLDKDTAWAVGNFPSNQHSISIEVCSNGEDYTEAEIKELIWLTQKLRKEYNVTPENVIRHYDVYDFAQRAGLTGNWVDPHKHCPAPYIDHDKWHNEIWLRIAPDGSDAGFDEPDQSGLTVDGYWGSSTTSALQAYLPGNLVADGEVWHQIQENIDEQPALTSGWCCDDTQEGSICIMALQDYIGNCECDGLMGKETVSALQQYLGCSVVDGELWEESPCVMELQKRLNEQNF